MRCEHCYRDGFSLETLHHLTVDHDLYGTTPRYVAFDSLRCYRLYCCVGGSRTLFDRLTWLDT
jgi:hypothetical protein